MDFHDFASFLGKSGENFIYPERFVRAYFRNANASLQAVCAEGGPLPWSGSREVGHNATVAFSPLCMVASIDFMEIHDFSLITMKIYHVNNL